MGQIVQIVGALAILAAFALVQAGVLGTRSRGYLLLNLAGAVVLAVEAWLEAQLGFLLLEAAWAAVAAWGLAGLGLSRAAGRSERRRARSGAPRRPQSPPRTRTGAPCPPA
jgi:hypothetical protein